MQRKPEPKNHMPNTQGKIRMLPIAMVSARTEVAAPQKSPSLLKITLSRVSDRSGVELRRRGDHSQSNQTTFLATRLKSISSSSRRGLQQHHRG